ncbi:MAG: hypothetical protein ACTSRW_09290 [Candidatus Helarchaeota archaeon]
MNAPNEIFWMKAPYNILFEVNPPKNFDPWKYNVGNILTKILEQQKLVNEINLRMNARALFTASRLHKNKSRSLLPRKESKKNQEKHPETGSLDTENSVQGQNKNEIIQNNVNDSVSLQVPLKMLPPIRPPMRLMNKYLSSEDLIRAIRSMKYEQNRKKMKRRITKTRKKSFNIHDLKEARTNIEKLVDSTYSLIKEQPAGMPFIELISEPTRIQIIRTMLCLCYLINRKKINAWMTEEGEIFVCVANSD